MSDEFEAVVNRVADRVRPEDSEREALIDAAETLKKRVDAVVDTLPVDAEPVLAGSTTRETWIAGDRDIDLFVQFSPTLSRDKLRQYGLEVGHAVLPDGREEFAEHPYVVGEFRGFRVDLVPSYALEDATEIRSAVDRTPFHTEYVTERMDAALASDVRVCKQFFTGIGVYGSDLRTEGFSGFLTELLILEFDGFRPFLEAAADWKPPVRIDPNDHGTATFDDPLVVIDPTDPQRNVAAVLSTENVARVQHYARDLLDSPRESLFEPPERDPLEPAEIRAGFAARNTTPVALRVTVPDMVDDQLWPQLARSREGIVRELERRGFYVLRSAAFATDHDRFPLERAEPEDRTVVLLFELAVAQLPQVERHAGPPVHVRPHATSFYQTYADSDAAGPFINGDRYVVERERSVTSAVELLNSDALFEVALGTGIKRALTDGYDVLVGDELGQFADPFGEELAWYLDPKTRGQ